MHETGSVRCKVWVTIRLMTKQSDISELWKKLELLGVCRWLLWLLRGLGRKSESTGRVRQNKWLTLSLLVFFKFTLYGFPYCISHGCSLQM